MIDIVLFLNLISQLKGVASFILQAYLLLKYRRDTSYPIFPFHSSSCGRACCLLESSNMLPILLSEDVLSEDASDVIGTLLTPLCGDMAEAVEGSVVG